MTARRLINIVPNTSKLDPLKEEDSTHLKQNQPKKFSTKELMLSEYTERKSCSLPLSKSDRKSVV